MGQFMCSIVGTCLTLKETEKMARRFGYAGDRSSYQLHSWAVEACQRVPEVGKYLQKYLSDKYRLTMKRLDECEGEELGRAWKEAVQEGRVAGAYWAILTRLDAPEGVVKQVFSDVHMMSHLQGSEVRAELKELDFLRQDNHGLQERLNQLANRFEQVRQEREELKRSLSGKGAEVLDLGRRLVKLGQSPDGQMQGRELHRLKRENQALADRLAHEQKARERLEMRLFQETVRQLPGIRLGPEIGGATPEETAPPDEVCPLAAGEDCPRFCNKCILFVGGMDRLEPHYRSLVENDFGGKFMRHDGDCRNGQDRLINMVKRAEAVICPINCNSHRACLCVKKICKDLNKPCVLMRNSGLGSLKRTLLELPALMDNRENRFD
jgi:hypothetical protein